MASRVLKALTSRMCHKNMPADPPMKRGQHLSIMSWKSFSKKGIGHTGSARPLQGLLLRLPRLAERVANAVTFLTHICASNTSKRLGNGRGVPLSGTYVPWIGTHRSNRRLKWLLGGEQWAGTGEPLSYLGLPCGLAWA